MNTGFYSSASLILPNVEQHLRPPVKATTESLEAEAANLVQLLGEEISEEVPSYTWTTNVNGGKPKINVSVELQRVRTPSWAGYVFIFQKSTTHPNLTGHILFWRLFNSASNKYLSVSVTQEYILSQAREKRNPFFRFNRKFSCIT